MSTENDFEMNACGIPCGLNHARNHPAAILAHEKAHRWQTKNVYACVIYAESRKHAQNHATAVVALSNVTRWSSTKNMIERYLQLLPYIGDIVTPELQMAPRENECAQALCRKLSEIDILTKEFQDENLHIHQVRDFLDAAVAEFPEFEQHCSISSDIVCDPSFETAVVKVQKSQLEGEPLSLSRKEKASIKHLLKPNTATEATDHVVEQNVDLIGFAAAIRRLKKRKLDSPNKVRNILTLGSSGRPQMSANECSVQLVSPIRKRDRACCQRIWKRNFF